MALLGTIKTPADLRKLTHTQLDELATEMRSQIFEAVSANGGHLASNLGVVELTLALHYVYNFGAYPAGPDRLLWDVGHQSYPHKMVTGRAGQFPKLRKKGSVSGFPSPEESPFDLFAVGHAGTAISTAVGMAKGDQLLKKNSHVVAVVGDSSIVNGMAFEGLNGAGMLKRQLLIILNDNGMSISKPQGAFAQYLDRVRVSETYEEAKKFGKRIVDELPGPVGHAIEGAWHVLRDGIKHAIIPGQVFESFGVKYLGPIDGHDIPGLINTLAEIKHVQGPVLLHVRTTKGKGYDVCCEEPTKFHSPAAFRVEGCRVELNKGSGKSWTTAFADAMIDLAGRDPRVVAMTAAMPDGTGLSKFEKVYPDRFVDTGICESHLMGMAAGLCKSGMRPFAAIYSTFTQRAFDQFWQEVALNRQPVVLCMDRAGYVGDDGAVHHGFMDQAFLRPLPGVVLMAPSDEAELNRSLRLALSLETPSAIRYPRDNVPAENFDRTIDQPLRAAAAQEWKVGHSRVLRDGPDATLIVYGALAQATMAAAEELAGDGINVAVIDARFCKPVDGEMISRSFKPGHAVLTIEDHTLQNGFGSAVLEYALAHKLPAQNLTRLGMPDRLIAHASRNQQLAEVGLDAAGIARSVRDAVREAITAAREGAGLETQHSTSIR
ncbi:MAG TPA: 1-deoxy-D-xylulose-5-phosphate synthase [Humisphaera sp.]|jgi:1-deoxy-D-xylulose-5-phosphate synthase|nr:1-deoxy-D-xylulose-5-phosphate synthase [Humisphaera sp.]